jgi:hypothetical protein
MQWLEDEEEDALILVDVGTHDVDQYKRSLFI